MPKGDGEAATTRQRWLQGARSSGSRRTGRLCRRRRDTERDAFGTEEPTGTEREGLPEVSGTYRTVTPSRVNTLNPLYNHEGSAGTIIGYALDNGYAYRPGNERFTQLYDLTTDRSEVWTATLRENLRFSEPYG